MEKKIIDSYLEKINLSKALCERVEQLIDLSKEVNEIEFEDILVSEHKNEEGKREYTSLWIFNDSYVTECKNFAHSNNIDLLKYKDKIEYAKISLTDFDLKATSESSRVKIEFNFGSASGDLTSTEENCIYAYNIYKKYIIPNLL